MVDEEEESILEELTTEVQETSSAVQKKSSTKEGAGDSSVIELCSKEVGTSESYFTSDKSSECGVCRQKKRKKKRKKKQPKPDWPAAPIEYNPCPHLHFKTSTFNRYALSRDQHTSLLATPKGYRWETHTEIRYTRKGKEKNENRILRKAPKETEKDDKLYIGHFLGEIWNSLPTKMAEQLRQLLVEEFGMNEDEADEFIEQQKEFAHTKEEKKSKRKLYCPPETKIGVRQKWIKDFSRIFADKVTDYVVTMLSCRRTPRVHKLAEALLNHFCAITGEKTTLKAPKTKLQRIQVFIADRVAVWFDSLMKETEDRKTKDESVEAKISQSEKSTPPSEAEKGEGGGGEEPNQPKSKAASETTSKQTSEEGSKGGSKSPSKSPSKPSSKTPSTEGSKVPSQTSLTPVGEGDEGEEGGAEAEGVEEEATLSEEEGGQEGEFEVTQEDEEEEEEDAEEEEEAAEMEGEGEVEDEGEEEVQEGEEEEFQEGEEGVEGESRLGLEEELEEVEEEEGEEISSEESEESEVQITVPPPLPPFPIRDRSLIYQLTKDRSKYNVRQLSSGTVALKVAEARKREVPVRGGALKEKPLTDSPLNLQSMKEWADWAAEAAEVSQQWTKWVDKTITAAEEKSRMKKGKVLADDGGPLKLTKEDWQQWQVLTKIAVDEISKKKQEWKRNVETWKLKTEKATQRIALETETNVTNFSSEGSENPHLSESTDKKQGKIKGQDTTEEARKSIPNDPPAAEENEKQPSE